MHISHTIEQLEAARMYDSITTAVRIIRAYLLAAGRRPTLGWCAHLARCYWHDPSAALILLHSDKPN